MARKKSDVNADLEHREDAGLDVVVRNDQLVVEPRAAINDVDVDPDVIREQHDEGVPEEGGSSGASFPPDEAEAINKARLARGETDLVEGDPHPEPPPVSDDQPEAAAFDINTKSSLVDKVDSLENADTFTDRSEDVIKEVNDFGDEVDENKDESAS